MLFKYYQIQPSVNALTKYMQSYLLSAVAIPAKLFFFISDPTRLFPFTVFVDDVACATITSGRGIVQPVAEFTCTQPMKGFVVRLQKTGGDCCLNLGEVEIYGKCTLLFPFTQSLHAS
jgi:hypothetical protein